MAEKSSSRKGSVWYHGRDEIRDCPMPRWDYYCFFKILGANKRSYHWAGQIFFQGTMDIAYMNHTFITLIPKVQNLNEISQFRPISRVNTTHKLISKILSNRLAILLQIILKKKISPLKKKKKRFRQIKLHLGKVKIFQIIPILRRNYWKVLNKEPPQKEHALQ